MKRHTAPFGDRLTAARTLPRLLVDKPQMKQKHSTAARTNLSAREVHYAELVSDCVGREGSWQLVHAPDRALSVDSRRIGIVLIPQFDLISFSMIIEPLRSANLVTEQQLYEWVLLSSEGGDVASNSGIALATTALKDVADIDFDLIIVVAGL